MSHPLAFRRRSDVLLAALDVAVALGVAFAAFTLRFEGQLRLGERYWDRYRIAFVVTAVVWVCAARACGLYTRRALRLGLSNVESAYQACLVTGGTLLAVNWIVLGGDLSRAWIGLVVLGLMLGGLVSRGALRRFRRALVPLGFGLERYVVVGEPEPARRLVGDLTRARGAPFVVVATLPPTLSAPNLVEAVRDLRADGLIMSPGRARADAAVLARLCSALDVDVLVAPAFGDLEARVATIALLHGVPLLRVAGLAPGRRAQRQRPRDRAAHGVAVLGTRGIPANYGGFETFAERLALCLVEAGLAVTVYGRSRYISQGSPWRGVRLVVLPTIRSKYLDTVVHTALSALHLVLTRGPRDVVLCNAANAPVLVLLRLFRRRVILNVDGLEWRRTKWGRAGRTWYRLGEWLSVRLASVLVTDAYEVQTYYRVRHDTDSVMIPYGADLLDRGSLAVPAAVPVQPERYALYVSRWERENNPVLVAAAHARAGCGLDLVMLGQATYETSLAEEVRQAASPQAHLPGALYGDAYLALQANAACYIHATEVGGTHPALIEALGAGNVCLVLDTPENREVAGDAAVYFADEDGLVTALRWAATLAPDERASRRAQAREHAEARFSWDAVTRSYLTLLRG